MSVRVRVGAVADRQIQEAGDWWLRNRSKAPLAFAEDLDSAFDLLEAVPGAGEPLHHRSIAGLRRLLIARIRYFLYYTLDDDGNVEVLALWHVSRRRPPSLRR